MGDSQYARNKNTGDHDFFVRWQMNLPNDKYRNSNEPKLNNDIEDCEVRPECALCRICQIYPLTYRLYQKGTRPDQSMFLEGFPKSLVLDIEKQPREDRSNSTVVI